MLIILFANTDVVNKSVNFNFSEREFSMKSTDSVKNYPSEVRLYTNYAIKNIKNICKTFGPRPVGSEAEKNAREYLAKELRTTCDTVDVEPFRCSDKAFMSWPVIGSVLMIISCALLTFGLSAVSLALCALTLFIFLTEFVFYKPVLDVFFPKAESGNVIGVRNPSGETTKRIVLTGHIDSAYEWTYNFRSGPAAFRLIAVNAVFSVIFVLGTGIYYIVSGVHGIVWFNGDLVAKILVCLCYATVPGLVSAFFFTNFKKPVTGANDNLSGCMLSAAVLKYMEANNIRLENTEIDVLLCSGEEAGLRGSKAWAKAHASEIKNNKDVCTVFLALDTVREFDFFKIYDREMNGTVRNDSRMTNLVTQAAQNVGFVVPAEKCSFGATDSAAFSQAGLTSAALTAMESSPAKYYHTRLDAEDNLDPKSLETGLKIALETVYLFDEQGI